MKNKSDERKPVRYELTVPASNRKAFLKILQGLKDSEVISQYNEADEPSASTPGNQSSIARSKEAMDRYHDLVD